jgi:hypothetical protein
VAYYQPTWNLNGSLSTSRSIVFPNSASSTINANISGREGEEFLPPHATISRTGMLVKSSGPFILPTDISNEKIKVQGVTKRIKRGTFKKDNSPMIFRSYLTFVQANNPEKIFSTDHTFYVSQLLETLVGPAVIWDKPTKPGDTFFVSGIIK